MDSVLQELILSEEFAIVGLANDDLAILYGPFEDCEQPTAHHNFVYFNDFFLQSQAPFLKAKSCKVVRKSERENFFISATPPDISWDKNNQDSFLESFAFFRNLIDKKELVKAVPISFTSGKIEHSPQHLCWFLKKLFSGQNGLSSYALKRNDFLLLGATPEILFSLNRKEREIHSEAVAGSIIKTHAPLSDITGKLQKEHQLVVEDLVLQLSKFGQVRKEEVTLKSLTALSHLRTPLEVKCNDDINLNLLINALHPSGALGILPRAEIDHSYYKALDPTGTRKCFGAPFGAIFENGDATFLVAIRNLMISGSNIQLGAGAGITAESEPNSELTEVLAKQNSVRVFFGLT